MFRTRSSFGIALLCLFLMLPAALVADTSGEPPERMYLHKDWQLQSSCEVKATGAQIAAPGFEASKWHHSDIPTTVVAALVADKTYSDPFYATNLRSFPGMNQNNKVLWANVEMAKGSPFRCSWWYRTEFILPAGYENKTTWLNFLGINYRANIWINGQKVAEAKDVAGAYRTFEFQVGKYLLPGKTNALAVEIFAPKKDDLEITWVDWNPTPPDKMMGIWREVFLTTSADVSVRHSFVASKLGGNYKTVALTVSAELHNVSNHPVQGVLRAEIGDIQVRQPVSMAPAETKTVHLAPEQFPQLTLANPRLWWPYQMGQPNLYTAKVTFETGEQVSDSQSFTFGIREVTSELTPSGARLFKVNGRNVLIRGAAWADDMLLRWSSERLDADLQYVRDMGLNAIRLEGHLNRDEFFEKTDRLGILVMPGWSCCDAWERWKDWKEDQPAVAAASLRSQIWRLRNHASVFVWLYGSDGPPPAAVERMYLGILKDLEWPNPSLSSASADPTTVTGKSGVKMTGPYEYVPPVYWLTDKDAGGADGYNTETSPGPAIPPRESLERFLPKDHLWPIDDFWNFHAGGERFTTLNVFTDGMTKRYGKAADLDDYLRKAQAITYDGQRAMFEAYARNKYNSTGVIQWMLNNAWPSLIWHLYDFYLVPSGGYFGTKKACEPLHVQYSFDNNSVAVINGKYESQQGMKASAKIYNLDAKEMATKEAILDLAPDSSTKAFDLPRPEGLSQTYFLRLQLHDANGKLVSDNFYWLSRRPDVLDWAHKQDTVYTPQKEFGDLTGLNSLPQVKVEASMAWIVGVVSPNQPLISRVQVKNPGQSVAFMVHLRLTNGKGGEDIVPVIWDDNYFSLLPGEKREVNVSYAGPGLRGQKAVLEVDGFNITPQTIE